MPLVEQLVFRKLTDADFFNINKPPGIEVSGGGQSYIDFSTSAVTLRNWREFFSGITEETGRRGPKWVFKARSLGTQKGKQEITIGQRRDTSFNIRSQKLLSRRSKRVYAWRPDLTGFPVPTNPAIRSHIYDLHVYIVRLENNEYWAGWFQKSEPEPNWPINDTLNRMFTENEGYLTFSGDVDFDTNDPEWPFRIRSTTTSPSIPVINSDTGGPEAEQEKVFFDCDEIIAQDTTPMIKETIRKTRVRNAKSIRKLKQLYKNLCQISGDEYAFKKRDGSYYSEAHHLVSLGEGGSDSVRNIVILSPLIHRMLHYAKVEGIDLHKIESNKLDIKINGVDYTITWHPDHAQIVQGFA